jgi:hypothetical protein
MVALTALRSPHPHNEDVGIFIFLSSENINEEQISNNLNNSYVQLFVITSRR